MTTGYEFFRQPAVKAGAGELSELTSLVNQLFEAEQEVAQLEAALSQAKRRVMLLAQGDIPDLMDRVGLEKFTASGGLNLTVTDTIRASIPVAQREEAYRWLDDHNHGGLIKRRVEVAFSRDQEKDARKLLKELRGRFDDVREERKVEPMTLKAFIREQLEQGAAIPLDLFGAERIRIAKIKVLKTT